MKEDADKEEEKTICDGRRKYTQKIKETKQPGKRRKGIHFYTAGKEEERKKL